MAVYGTNCLKFGGEDPEEARPWLVRELHIVQPKLLVVMGERTRRVPERARVPARRPDRPGRRRAAALHRHDRGARRPGHRRRARRGAREDRLLERVQGGRRLVRRAAAVLSRSRWAALAGLTAALAAYTAGAGRLWDAGLWPDVLFLSLVLIPGDARARLAAAAARASRRGLLVGRPRARGAGGAAPARRARRALQPRQALRARSRSASGSSPTSRRSPGPCSIAAIIPWVDAVRSGAARPSTSSRSSRRSSTTSRSRSASRARTALRTSGRPDILFFALFLAAAARFGLRAGLDLARR